MVGLVSTARLFFSEAHDSSHKCEPANLEVSVVCDGKMTMRSSSMFNHQIIHLQPKMPDFGLMSQAAPTARPASIADRSAKPISAITWLPTP
jgi:hypothetical protein